MNPADIAIDSQGVVYVVDGANNAFKSLIAVETY